MASIIAAPIAARPSGALRLPRARSHAVAGTSPIRRAGGLQITAKLTVPPAGNRPAPSYNSKLFSVPSGDDAVSAGVSSFDEIPEEVVTEVRTRARNRFKPGVNLSAENWNGRLAMVGVVGAFVLEYVTGQGPLSYFGILG